MDFLIDNIFTNLYITVPSIILWWALYIYFTINVYLEYVNRIDVTEHYRHTINSEIASWMFWIRDKEKVSSRFLDNARIIYYIIHSLCWPINWFYHKFISKDIGEGVKRRRKELERIAREKEEEEVDPVFDDDDNGFTFSEGSDAEEIVEEEERDV